MTTQTAQGHLTLKLRRAVVHAEEWRIVQMRANPRLITSAALPHAAKSGIFVIQNTRSLG
jgi:hypothetical protein